ncbi:MAG: DUF3881 family protein [Lachnospiraceae bacterium]|nr:DUF3881 family protein [Lachnospiraceae bacterium]
MHKYLRAIGFHDIKKEELQNILYMVAQSPDYQEMTLDSEGGQFTELRKDVAYNMGLALRGTYDENDEFVMDYYFPYFNGNTISTDVPVEVIRQSDRESYQGLCDDVRLGIDLIFYLQDVFTILKSDQRDKSMVDFGGVKLSGLASEGKILLPMKNSKKENAEREKVNQERNELISAAREGDSKALEKLTLEDMDTYSQIQKRLEKEDVLTIVNTYFMPSGIECDKYSILGDIVGYKNYVNKMTMELVHVLEISCNHISFNVVINSKDLLGEPEVGRRFKGNIWMQGRIT